MRKVEQQKRNHHTDSTALYFMNCADQERSPSLIKKSLPRLPLSSTRLDYILKIRGENILRLVPSTIFIMLPENLHYAVVCAMLGAGNASYAQAAITKMLTMTVARGFIKYVLP